MIFLKTDRTLKKINFYGIDKEKILQQLIEENLLEVLDIRLLASEYVTTSGGRIDTLGIDSNNVPVIIEYKRNKNDNVINQSLSYLKWLKSQKVEFFERLVSKKFGGENLPKIDWDNPRVICIAESYNRFDTDTLEFISVNLELYKYQYYENNIFTLENVKGDGIGSKILRPTGENKQLTKPKDEIISTDLETRLVNCKSEIRTLFYELQERILALDEKIERVSNTAYIGFRTTKIFTEAHVQKDNILIVLRAINYNDFPNVVEEVPSSHGWGKKIKVRIRNEEELNYLMPLIERSYESTK